MERDRNSKAVFKNFPVIPESIFQLCQGRIQRWHNILNETARCFCWSVVTSLEILIFNGDT